MSLKSQKILKISLTTNSKKEILEFIKNGLKKDGEIGQKTYVCVTPNPEQVVLAHKNSHFRDILNQADIAIPDGIGLVWAYSFFGFIPKVERITGVGLLEDLVRQASQENVPVGLIGGWGQVAVKAFECLRQKYPRVQGWALGAPEFGIKKNYELGIMNEAEDTEAYFANLAQKIKETNTQMIFVGLGAPKQEYFIEELRSKMDDVRIEKPILLMAVGGAFDEISGRLPMTPKFIERYGLKWLWRLILEPWRWKRQLALLEFVWLVAKEKIRGR